MWELELEVEEKERRKGDELSEDSSRPVLAILSAEVGLNLILLRIRWNLGCCC